MRTGFIGVDDTLGRGLAAEDAGRLFSVDFSGDVTLDVSRAVEMADASWSARNAVSSRFRYAVYTANCSQQDTCHCKVPATW